MSIRPVIVHHKGNLDNLKYPPNSLEAVRASLEAGADCVEVDILALAAGDYLVVHDELLETETTGSGPVMACTPEQARTLYIRWHDEEEDNPERYPVPLLSEVVALLEAYPGKTRLQLDFKNFIPFASDEPLRRLVELVRPLGERVIVTSCADWQLRRLRRLAPWLDLGFDILFYLDWRDPNREYDSRLPPFRESSYGYFDDHLLAVGQSWPVRDYLADRCEVLARQVPGASALYINHALLIQSLDDGFNWAEALASMGMQTVAWTLDADNSRHMAHTFRLYENGVRQFTSNTPLALAGLLGR
ncbi:MAG: glycerophosphodiester phosphodiesterase [Phototrophicaceae bacterium]